MSEALAARLDLELAWRRVKYDISDDRVFVRHPNLIDVVEVNLDQWLENLREEIASGEFQPNSLHVCDVPKPGGAIRPAGNLRLADQVIYSALVADALPQIKTAVQWGNPYPDFAYRLRDNPQETSWFENFLRNWKAMTSYSLACIQEGFSHVVIADVAGYFEQVDIYTLRSDLNGLAINAETLQCLEKCLHRWAQVPRRGIPQGFSASDVLGKLYLNAIDSSLAGAGYKHCRYVDDYRIFCNSNAEARRALLLLTKSLRHRGLVVQTAKTKILSAGDARQKFEDVPLAIDEVKDELLEKLNETANINSTSLAITDIDTALKELESNEPVDLLAESYRKNFIESGSHFNKSLFRFLLGRLGNAGDHCALEHALSILQEYPEETAAILSYISALDEVANVENTIIDYLDNENAVYTYQIYQILKWRRSQDGEPTERLMLKIREYALSDGVAPFLRAEARAALGQWGLPADLETLMHAYGNANGDIEKVEIICAVVRMESGRRNGFLGQVAGDSDLCSRAVRLVRRKTQKMVKMD